jgi:hypothetical protein
LRRMRLLAKAKIIEFLEISRTVGLKQCLFANGSHLSCQDALIIVIPPEATNGVEAIPAL